MELAMFVAWALTALVAFSMGAVMARVEDQRAGRPVARPRVPPSVYISELETEEGLIPPPL